MADQELVIKISAKNLTATEFADARKQVAGLSADTKKASDDGAMNLKNFSKAGADVGETFVKAGALVGAAIVGMVAGVVELGKRGAMINDVRDNFDVLNKAIGLDGKQSIDTLNKAVDGMIPKFDLMKITNKGLSEGLRLTNTDLTTLGEGARVVAERIGGSTTEAYETLINAMSSGKTLQLKSIGVNIDETQALNDHAKALGVDVTELNERGKKLALQTALQAELSRIVKEGGRATMDFGDSFEAAQSQLSNWMDDLGSSIATSKVLGVALSAAGDIIKTVFGNDNGQLIKTIVSDIEFAAITMVEWARTAVSAGDLIMRTFNATQVVFDAVGMAVAKVGQGFFKLVEGLSYVASFVPGVGDSFASAKDQASQFADYLGGVSDGFRDAGGAALQAAAGERDSDDMFVKLDKTLTGVRNKMADAMAATDAHTDSTNKNTKATNDRVSAGDQILHTLKEEQAAWDELQKQQEELSKATAAALEGGAKGQPNFLKQWMSRSTANQQTLGNQLLDRTPTANAGGIVAPMLDNGATEAQRQMQELLHPTFTSGMTDLIKTDMPKAMLAAIEGGGNPITAAGGLMGGQLGQNVVSKFGTSITGALGQTLGGAINTILPGIGTLIGPLIGKIGSAIKSLFGGPSKDELDARSLQDTMISQLRAIMTSGEQTEGALKDNYHTIAIVARDAFLKTGMSAQDAEKKVAALLDTHNPENFKAAMQDLNNVLDGQKQDEADLNAAIQEYGFSIDELGPKMRQQQLTQQAVDLENQFQLLVGSGIDVGVVTDHMSEKLNAYLQTAMKSGSEVPSEMQPIIESMIKQGTLVDANGNKITSLTDSGITFSETMTQGFDRVVNALNKVLEGLGLIPKALDAIPTNKTITITEQHQSVYDSGDNAPPSFADEGYVKKPTLAMVGDVPGGEFVLKPSTIQKWLGQAASGGSSASIDISPMVEQVSRMRSDLRAMPGTVARAVTTGILRAR